MSGFEPRPPDWYVVQVRPTVRRALRGWLAFFPAWERNWRKEAKRAAVKENGEVVAVWLAPTYDLALKRCIDSQDDLDAAVWRMESEGFKQVYREDNNMPHINFASVNESTGGYVCRITGVKAVPGKDYVFLEWDVAEGPMAGIFADSNFPPRDVMSWKESARGMTKHKLKVLAEANPTRLHVLVDPTTKEFATVAEFDGDDWDSFVGCTFGAVIRKRLYTDKNGNDREAVEVGAFKSPQDIRDGNWRPMPPRDQRETHHDQPFPPSARPAQQAAAIDDSDIPF